MDVRISQWTVVHTQPRIMSIWQPPVLTVLGDCVGHVCSHWAWRELIRKRCNSWYSAFWWGSDSELLYTMTLLWQFIYILYTSIFVCWAPWSLCNSLSFLCCLWSSVFFSVVVRLRVGWGRCIYLQFCKRLLIFKEKNWGFAFGLIGILLDSTWITKDSLKQSFSN